jgi:hypothetical protein
MTGALDKLAADFAQIGADAERIRADSAEALWILHGIVPPKIPTWFRPRPSSNRCARPKRKPMLTP